MATEKLTYAKAIAELEEIVARIETNQYDIDDLTEKVRRVSVLVSFCKERLHKTETEVQKIFDDLHQSPTV